MSRRTTVIAVVICLIAIGSFAAWPLWSKLLAKEASAQLRERTKALVDKNANLKPDWDKAMEDGKLTFDEAKAIVEKAGEKVEPE